MTKITMNSIEEIVENLYLLESDGKTKIPYPHWDAHKAGMKKPFLVTADKAKGAKFDYYAFKVIMRFIDPKMYVPTHQVCIIEWGGSALDLVQFIVHINSHMSNFLDRVLAVAIETNEQSGWYLKGGHTAARPNPLWPSYLPKLTHIP
ncbi:MAG: hypothetical protein ABF572_11145 [Gluconobacter sp.]|uniref:hypothetical protein n=1 Tax=Gluconobacter sp. TaxID=1876758 RepID=UPI0039E7F621